MGDYQVCRVLNAILDAALSDAKTDEEIGFEAAKALAPDHESTMIFWTEVPGIVRKLRALKYRGHS